MKKLSKKIFVISQQGCTNQIGGAITVFVNLCNMLTEFEYKVFGICSSKKDGKPNNLDNNVIFINLFYRYKDKNFSQGLNSLSEETQPDLYIFFYADLYVNASLSEKFRNIPRILMFHSRPDYYFIKKQLINKLKDLYTNTTSQILFNSYTGLLPDFIKNSTVVTIPNFIKKQKETINVNIEKKKIIYLSRITYCKGFEFLINSFKLIANKYKDWSIDIYGQSQPEHYEKKLINLTKSLKIDKQIIFKGITNNPFKTFLNYDFCVFPSYFEGFPMGLIEAQSIGLPCIGLRECSGVNELIIDNYNGYLTKESLNDFALKIEKLILDKDTRTKFSKNAIITSNKYDYNIISQKWNNLIEQIINRKNIDNNIISTTKDISVFPIHKIILVAYSCDKM